jgi:hypothetical protein
VKTPSSSPSPSILEPSLGVNLPDRAESKVLLPVYIMEDCGKNIELEVVDDGENDGSNRRGRENDYCRHTHAE